MATDPTVLNDAAATFLQALIDAADLMDWHPDAAVAAGEPSYDCDSLYVWLSNITPETDEGGCVVALEIELSYAVAECVGADRDETAIFTNAAANQDHIWGIVATIAGQCCDSTLLGENADNVKIGAVNLTTTDGGLTIYTGTITGVLATVETI